MEILLDARTVGNELLDFDLEFSDPLRQFLEKALGHMGVGRGPRALAGGTPAVPGVPLSAKDIFILLRAGSPPHFCNYLFIRVICVIRGYYNNAVISQISKIAAIMSIFASLFFESNT